MLGSHVLTASLLVMEYLSGGEIKWRNEQNEPVLQVDQCRRICRDVILGLEYRKFNNILITTG